MLMSLEEQGCYLRMLCLQWEHGYIERKHLRGLLGMTEEQVNDLLDGPVGEAFTDNDEGHLVNRRLFVEQEDASALIEKRRRAGRARATKANAGPTSASAEQSSANTDAEAEAKAKGKKRRRNAEEELHHAIADWERMNGPMPSRLREALIDYRKVRSSTAGCPLWTREMWLRNLAVTHTPNEWAAAYEEATRCGWKSVHPKSGRPVPGSMPNGRARGNDFADLLEGGDESQ